MHGPSLLSLQRPPRPPVPSSGRPLPAPGHERVPHRKTPAVDARLDRADLHCGDRGDPFVREALDITQEKGRTLLRGETGKSLRVAPTGPLHKQSARLGGDTLHEGPLAASTPVR